MFGFLLKKSFFDGCDNLVTLMVMNVGYVAIIAATVAMTYFGYTLTGIELVGVLGLLIGIFLFDMYAMGISGVTYAYSRYRKEGPQGFRDAYRGRWPHIFRRFFYHCLMVFGGYAVYFYFSVAVSRGTAAMQLVFTVLAMAAVWLEVVLTMALFFYYPLAMHLPEDDPKKTMKKSFMMVLDNFGLCWLLLLRSIFDLAISVFIAFILPGFMGMNISQMDCTKFLLMKYDWLDANPGMTKKDIYWDDILFDERQKVGKRTLGSIFAPWKY